MGSFWQDVKYGLRVLGRSPAFTTVGDSKYRNLLDPVAPARRRLLHSRAACHASPPVFRAGRYGRLRPPASGFHHGAAP